MKIRAVTLGLDLPFPSVDAQPLRSAASFLDEASHAFADDGIEVQTTRAAGPSLGPTLTALDDAAFASWARDVEAAARDAGIGYLSLGRIPADLPERVEALVAPVLAAGEIVFLSAELLLDGLPSIRMASACATAVQALAESTPSGFGNLRFAATAGCPPNIPFLPAAYHAGGKPAFAIAVQAADLLVAATREPGGMLALEDRLVGELERAVGPVERVAESLAERSGYTFVGIDLSPAPFPSDDESVGTAFEAAGVQRFGAPGSLYVAAAFTRALRRTRVKRSGFSGLMLPILEDSVLARRYGERPPGLNDLLVFSAVCGTGLDTVPLPGSISHAELAGIYLDVAALSSALGGKPLTARLFPIPGTSGGEATAFDFDFFSNSRVPQAPGGGAAGLLARGQ